jgi:hypothetical protein
MRKTIIYGVTAVGQNIFQYFSLGDEVLAFTDYSPKNYNTQLFGLAVVPPKQLCEYSYDAIVVGSFYPHTVNKIVHDLVDLGIDRSKIDIQLALDFREYYRKSRDFFLESFSKVIYEKNLVGNLAEGGVYRGDFSAKINQVFPDRKLYLFDTFEGFDERDTKVEQSTANEHAAGYLAETSIEVVREKLKYPDKVIIKKGYFPETAIDIEDNFVFVNLDFDLYAPTIAGLEFFWPKMTRGRIILVHDYFVPASFIGAKKAADEFISKHNLLSFPIGDLMSIGIIKG